MTERRDPRRDGLESALEAWMTSGDDAPVGTCLDANELAAFASGRVLDAERPRIEEHLGTCRDCRAAVGSAVRAEGQPSPSVVPTPRRHRPRIVRYALAIAAVAVLAVLVATRVEEPATPPSTEDALRQELAALRDARPELFGELALLSREERLRRADAAERGGSLIEAPVGTVLSDRPRFAWRSGRPATLVISTDGGVPIVRMENVLSPWNWPGDLPALPRGGTYLVELETPGVLGTERASGTFVVAADGLAERYARQVETVTAMTAAPLRSLLLAQVALRHGLLAEARTHAEAYVAEKSDDRVGRETLRQVLWRLGDPDAAKILEDE